jgi:acid phosphatase
MTHAVQRDGRTTPFWRRPLPATGLSMALLLLGFLALGRLSSGPAITPPFATIGAPAAAPEHSLSFVALGDTGMGNANQRRVAAAMSAITRFESIDLVLLLGDNFYDDGVQSRNDRQWDTAFENVYRLPGLAVPFYAVLGNHDHHGRIEAQIERTVIDDRWRMPARYHAWTQPLGEQHQVFFVALDTETLAHRESDDAQLAWLDQTLATSKATWKIALGHHPLLQASPNSHPHLAMLRDTLDRLGVDAYFCGHSHQLTYFRRPGLMAQIISGAGSNPRSLEGDRGADFAHRGLGFVCVRLTGQAMLLSFLDADNRVLFIDTLAPRSGPAPQTQAPLEEHPD